MWGCCRTLTNCMYKIKYSGSTLASCCPVALPVLHTPCPSASHVLWALPAVLDTPGQCQAKQGQERCLELSGTMGACPAWAFCQH